MRVSHQSHAQTYEVMAMTLVVAYYPLRRFETSQDVYDYDLLNEKSCFKNHQKFIINFLYS
jgi:hypothetical protein